MGKHISLTLVLILILVTGCSSTTITQTVTIAQTGASENIHSYRILVRNSHQSEVKPPNEEFWEFMLPDRAHAIINRSHTRSSNGVTTLIEERTEFYIIGDSLYYLTDNDIDLSLENNSGYYHPIHKFPTQQYIFGTQQFAYDIHQQPDENIDGVDYLHFEGIYKTGGRQLETWIDKENYFVREMILNSESGNTDLFRFWDINTYITIEPPLTATGELLPGWEVKNIQPIIARIPITEAIASITGNEDWTDPAVKYQALDMMRGVTEPQAYFDALPPEGQEYLAYRLSPAYWTDRAATRTIIEY